MHPVGRVTIKTIRFTTTAYLRIPAILYTSTEKHTTDACKGGLQTPWPLTIDATIPKKRRPRPVQIIRPEFVQPSTDRARRTWEEQIIGGPSIYISRMARVFVTFPAQQTQIPCTPRIWSTGRPAGGSAHRAPGWRDAMETAGSSPRDVCRRRVLGSKAAVPATAI